MIDTDTVAAKQGFVEGHALIPEPYAGYVLIAVALLLVGLLAARLWRKARS